MSLTRKPTASPPPSPEGADEHGLRPGMDGLVDLMNRLLSPEPDGCPWDRRQTLDTLRPYLLEETHEVLDAMHDPDAHCGELGDLLFQIVFQSALREREGSFSFDDVVDSIRTKMIRRHPHVFPPPGSDRTTASTAEEVAAQWDEIKRAEKRETDDTEGPVDPFAGLPKTLPALSRASQLQDKAARLGFDWPDLSGAVAKFEEEWDELTRARASGEIGAIREELGDLLFVLCRIASRLKVDAEDALRRANAKFERRFAHVLARCHEAGVDPRQVGLAELDRHWNEAKQLE